MRDTEPKPVFRFAPSPNGELHVGHAFSALTGFLWARHLGGRFLVRIEDIDVGRARRAFISQIYQDLEWLGLSWEEPVLRQSDHFALYGSKAEMLCAMGLLYPCFATRRELQDAAALCPRQAIDPDGTPIYPGLYKAMPESEVAARKSAGVPYALRLDMERALALLTQRSAEQDLTYEAIDETGRRTIVNADPSRWGDAVIVRKDTPASYHLACVIDDARQGITHVTRGQDLEAATDLHVLLQKLLGLATPLYHHHALWHDEAGRKLAKRDKAIGLRVLREKGVKPEELLLRLEQRLPAFLRTRAERL